MSCDSAMPCDDSTTLDVIEDVASMDMVGWTDVETVQRAAPVEDSFSSKGIDDPQESLSV